MSGPKIVKFVVGRVEETPVYKRSPGPRIQTLGSLSLFAGCIPSALHTYGVFSFPLLGHRPSRMVVASSLAWDNIFSVSFLIVLRC
jgi:hypothetical protein